MCGICGIIKSDNCAEIDVTEIRASLDYKITEFVFKKVPSKLKVNGDETRILQKLLAKRLLPKELSLNCKQGFPAPIDTWL